ncbi:MAG: nucleotide-binding protein [Desulfurococcaceae archaeon]
MQVEEATAIVLDTGALLAKYYRLLPRRRVELYTSTSNVDEVIDLENKQALEEAINLGLVKVVKPEKKYVEKATAIASSTGSIHKLSRTDIDVAALALQLVDNGANVVVITDDYELQNLLRSVGISFKPLRTTGIRALKLYRSFCPVCGYVPSSPSENICPLCGSKIIRKVTRVKE